MNDWPHYLDMQLAMRILYSMNPIIDINWFLNKPVSNFLLLLPENKRMLNLHIIIHACKTSTGLQSVEYKAIISLDRKCTVQNTLYKNIHMTIWLHFITPIICMFTFNQITWTYVDNISVI